MITRVVTFLIADISVEPGWAVGAVTIGDPAIDRDLLVDADGAPWVPGSTLAGSLRAHLAAQHQAGVTGPETDLMGSPPPVDRVDGTDLEASRLWLLGTHFDPEPQHGDGPDSGVVETVGQTAIDRRRGAAKPTSLRYSRVVSAGGTLRAYLRVDGVLDAAQRRALASWRPAIGRGRTSGGGRARLLSLHIGEIEPSTSAGMRIWLGHDGPALAEAVAKEPLPVAPVPEPHLVEVTLRVEDGLLIGGQRSGRAATSRSRRGKLIIPGSAWKGLFRSRVEYILRSLYAAPDPTLVCSTEVPCKAKPDGGSEPVCLVCQIFGSPYRRGLLAFHDSTIDDAEQSIERTQVGIDRVTGGARDGLCFTSKPVTAGQLTLRVDALHPVDDWVRTVLWHVLRDLHDGLIGVGSRVSRGMGTLRLCDPPPSPGPLIPPPRTARAPDPAGTDDQAEESPRDR